ncbi:MAG: DUF4388 domain-containing protein [Oscillochloris sp.]|nr:DUF4388 domain-containing protein [Oscillochloris sp.]
MALEGDLSEFPLTDIIQLVDLSKQTGGVHIRGQRSGQMLEGWLYFRDGKIIGAEMPGQPPLEAVYIFFTLTSGPFRFHDDVRLEAPTVTISNEVIIMEGVMRQDAWMQIQDQVPSLTMVPRLVPNPSGTTEINLDAEEWRILTMVNGKNTVAQIAARSGLGEFRTCEIISELLRSGLIERRDVAPGEALAPEFERLASSLLGPGGANLLEEAYRLASIPDPTRASGEEMLMAVDHFEASASRLIGPARARQAAGELRSRAQEVLG